MAFAPVSRASSTPRGAFPRRALLQRACALGWLSLLANRMAIANPQKGAKAKRCLLIFMEGGPVTRDLWDMKPKAPAEVRGEFRPISTSAPGLFVCEHLPGLSQRMHLVSLVHGIHHGIVDHNAGAYYALTGRSPVQGGRLILSDDRANFPPYGAVCSALAQDSTSGVPAFVHLSELMSNNGFDLPGQTAGFLGARFDPLILGDASAPGWKLAGVAASDVGHRAVDWSARRRLLDQLDRADDNQIQRDYTLFKSRAFELMTSPETRRAFSLEEEPLATRERYGLRKASPDKRAQRMARDFGGLPHLGQAMLLARRLLESGVRFVTLGTGLRYDQAWDTHRQHFPLLKKSLLPDFDRAFSALLDDLNERGLLEETLVVALGEFGRTPRLGQITSGAGADAAGRDHWPHCFSALFAGGGMPGGAVHGASDRHAAYPARDASTPEDIAATIYWRLGIDPSTRVVDSLDRPHDVALGTPITRW